MYVHRRVHASALLMVWIYRVVENATSCQGPSLTTFSLILFMNFIQNEKWPLQNAKAGKALLYFSSVKNLAIENVLLPLPYLVLSTVLVWH